MRIKARRSKRGMTTDNFADWNQVQKDLVTAASDHTMAWYILNDQNQVVPADYHEWREWNETRTTHIIWDCTVVGVRIMTAFFGEGPRLFETARCSDESGFEVVDGYLIWADAAAGHRRRVDELQFL